MRIPLNERAVYEPRPSNFGGVVGTVWVDDQPYSVTPLIDRRKHNGVTVVAVLQPCQRWLDENGKWIEGDKNRACIYVGEETYNKMVTADRDAFRIQQEARTPDQKAQDALRDAIAERRKLTEQIQIAEAALAAKRDEWMERGYPGDPERYVEAERAAADQAHAARASFDRTHPDVIAEIRKRKQEDMDRFLRSD